MQYPIDPITGEVLWPPHILEKAREAVVAYMYEPNQETGILEGKFDHWHMIQIACYAITGQQPPKKEETRRVANKDRRVTLEDKLFLIEQEMDRKMKDQQKKMNKQIDFVHKSMDAKRKEILG